MWSCWLCWICWICPLGLVRAEIGTLLSTNMLTWQLPQPSNSNSIAYLFAGIQISSLTVARHRGQLRPGASSRDLPHPPSTLPPSLCVSLSLLGISQVIKKEEEIKGGWTSKCIDPGGSSSLLDAGFWGGDERGTGFDSSLSQKSTQNILSLLCSLSVNQPSHIQQDDFSRFRVDCSASPRHLFRLF